MTGYTCQTCGKAQDEDPNCFMVELPLYALEIPEAERRRRVVPASRPQQSPEEGAS